MLVLAASGDAEVGDQVVDVTKCASDRRRAAGSNCIVGSSLESAGVALRRSSSGMRARAVVGSSSCEKVAGGGREETGSTAGGCCDGAGGGGWRCRWLGQRVSEVARAADGRRGGTSADDGDALLPTPIGTRRTKRARRARARRPAARFHRG